MHADPVEDVTEIGKGVKMAQFAGSDETVDVNMVSSLLEQGAPINGSDNSFRDTALHRATTYGHKEVVGLLLAKGARIDAKDSFPGATPLYYAVRSALVGGRIQASPDLRHYEMSSHVSNCTGGPPETDAMAF